MELRKASFIFDQRLEEFFVRENFLKLFKSQKMEVDGRALNRHAALDHFSHFPVSVGFILLILISSSIIHHSNFLAHDLQSTGFRVYLMILLDVFKCDTQCFDSMGVVYFGLQALLIAQIPFILLNYE
jgi:hypothetical protein